MTRSVNLVFNYINELSQRSIKERGKFLSAYDIHAYTTGASKELGLHSQTPQCIAKVKTLLQAQDVKQAITRALERSARLEARFIQIDTKGSIVTLRGKVASWAEKEEAEEAAWAAPGVEQVDGHLSVAE